jgi:hypothetical protein
MNLEDTSSRPVQRAPPRRGQREESSPGTTPPEVTSSDDQKTPKDRKRTYCDLEG